MPLSGGLQGVGAGGVTAHSSSQPWHFFSGSVFIYFFIFLNCFYNCCLFLAVLDLSCSARASHYSGFSLQSMVEPRLVLGSVVVAHGLSCYGTWDLPGPGIEPVSPALAGGFLSTVPPGKSLRVGF